MLDNFLVSIMESNIIHQSVVKKKNKHQLFKFYLVFLLKNIDLLNILILYIKIKQMPALTIRFIFMPLFAKQFC